MLADLKKLFKILPGYLRLKFYLLFIFTFFGAILEVFSIGAIFPVLSAIINKKTSFIFLNYKIEVPYMDVVVQSNSFILPMIILLAIFFLKNFFLVFLNYYSADFLFKVNVYFSNFLYKNYLQKDYSFHLKRNPSVLINSVINETGMLTNKFMHGISIVVLELIFLFGIVAFFIVIEPVSTIYLVSILTMIAFLYFILLNKKLLNWGKNRMTESALKLKNVSQGLNGIKEVKIYSRENTFLEKFYTHAFNEANLNKKMNILFQLPRIGLELLFIIFFSFFMVFQITSISDIASYFPQLVLIGAAAFRIMPSINKISTKFQLIKYSYPVVNRILLLLKDDEIKVSFSENKNNTEITFNENFRINKLFFKYEAKNRKIFENTDMLINKGECVGFVGESGVGKSTLVDLICGLLKPSSGEILSDGKNLHENIKSWQKLIGYVPQNVYLTDDTIKENIIFGAKKNKFNEEKLSEAIKSAQLSELIRSLENGLETEVGERGIRLSGGQIQRIGIARALYHNPKILIFDESTSFLDEENEKNILTDIVKLKKEKTLILISHKLSTLKICDKIFEFKNNKVLLRE